MKIEAGSPELTPFLSQARVWPGPYETFIRSLTQSHTFTKRARHHLFKAYRHGHVIDTSDPRFQKYLSLANKWEADLASLLARCQKEEYLTFTPAALGQLAYPFYMAARRKLPRLAPWQTERAAALGLPSIGIDRWKNLHPEDEDIILRRKREIKQCREDRWARQRPTDPLTELMPRLLDKAAALVARRLEKHRSHLAPKVAGLRRRKSIDAYGRLLLALYDTQSASDRAKNRAAYGCRFKTYTRYDSSDYARANYRRSRDAQADDYVSKEHSLGIACAQAEQAGVPFGWAEESGRFVSWVVYFDLPTGQVSFHSEERGPGPDYPGTWDGRHKSFQNILTAVDQYLADRPLARRPRKPA